MNITLAPFASSRWFLRLLGLCGLLVAGLGVNSAAAAANEALLAALRAADDERIAATTAASRERLEAIYSDDLHYAHSSGKVDTKASQIQGILSGASAYESFEHKERTFVPAAPGIALMKGRAIVNLRTKAGAKNTLDLTYLAVWREEKGKWRFYAWQSCRTL
jgi:ketosteroid isomerase-like protein